MSKPFILDSTGAGRFMVAAGIPAPGQAGPHLGMRKPAGIDKMFIYIIVLTS